MKQRISNSFVFSKGGKISSCIINATYTSPVLNWLLNWCPFFLTSQDSFMRFYSMLLFQSFSALLSPLDAIWPTVSCVIWAALKFERFHVFQSFPKEKLKHLKAWRHWTQVSPPVCSNLKPDRLDKQFTYDKFKVSDSLLLYRMTLM